jgi:(p)ppGpp synthase/HD superfamily hydrolase
MKTGPLTAKPLLWATRRSKQIGKKIDRGLDRVGQWLFPGAQAWPGYRPCLIDGPAELNLNQVLMEAKDPAGSAKAPSQSELLNLLKKEKYQEIELVERAMTRAESLPAPQRERNLRVAFQLLEWKLSATVIAASLLLGEAPEKAGNAKLRSVLENRAELNSQNCDYFKKDQVDNFMYLLYRLANNHESLLLLAAEDLTDLALLSGRQEKITPQIKRQAYRAFFTTSRFLRDMLFSGEAGVLEDLGLIQLFPEKAEEADKRFVALVGMDRLKSLEKLRSIAREIGSFLEARGIEHSLKFRVKKMWSFLQKEEEKGEVVDVNGIRIILHSENSTDCYMAFHDIKSFLALDLKDHHPSTGEIWEENADKRDDYIGRPKKNGYQSLHAHFTDYHGWPLELQVRTKEMDDIAEFGSASYAAYKSKAGGTAALAAVTGSKSLPQQLFDKRKGELEDSGTTIVYSRSGELVRMVTGSGRKLPTLLDFAFSRGLANGVHSIGGTINGQNATLHATVKTGQRVVYRRHPNIQRVEGRLKKVNTPFARALLVAASKGKIDYTKSLDYELLGAAGKKVLRELSEAIKSGPAYQKLAEAFEAPPTLLFSNERLAKLKAFTSTDELYITLALLDPKDPFVEEVKRFIEQNMVLALNQNKGRSSVIKIVAANRAGIHFRMLEFLETHDLTIHSLQATRLAGTDFVSFDFEAGFPRAINVGAFIDNLRDLYLHTPPLLERPGRTKDLHVRVNKGADTNEIINAIFKIFAHFQACNQECYVPKPEPKEDLIYYFKIQLPPGPKSSLKSIANLRELVKKAPGVRSVIVP